MTHFLNVSYGRYKSPWISRRLLKITIQTTLSMLSMLWVELLSLNISSPIYLYYDFLVEGTSISTVTDIQLIWKLSLLRKGVGFRSRSISAVASDAIFHGFGEEILGTEKTR